MERELIDWLQARLIHQRRSPAVMLGIGDDAALFDFHSDECVATSDMLMDGVDFIVDQHEFERIGRKALAVNLSDLAAMAAVPVAALVSLALPRVNALNIAQRIYEGMIPLANQFGVAIAGGDTNCWEGPLAICVTAVGRTKHGNALLRSGARPGDRIIVTGEFGGSLAGKHFDFTPRVHEALLLREHHQLHAGCDVSDGLALDLHRLTKASGCGAVVFADRIPVSNEVVHEHENSPALALARALGDGEDFELLLAVPPSSAAILIEQQPCNVRLSEIGFFTAEPELWLQHSDGSRSPLDALGYEHGKKEVS